MVFEPEAIVCHRNPKNLTEYQAKNAELCGQIDVYRVRRKHQRTIQTQHLLTLHRAGVTDRKTEAAPGMALSQSRSKRRVRKFAGR